MECVTSAAGLVLVLLIQGTATVRCTSAASTVSSAGLVLVLLISTACSVSSAATELSYCKVYLCCL